ncbi:flavonol 4'-sulfotransferase [Tanacetum coccineum]
MEENFKTLPQHTCRWSKGRLIYYKYKGFWNVQELHEGIMAQRSFKAQPSDVLLCSFPKTGTSWLKALAFAIKDLKQIEENHKNSCFPLVATHLPYTCLPKSAIASNCKIVYIYRNIKDVIVSYYNFVRARLNVPMEDALFEEAFQEFCQGISAYGPYWDHLLGYWKGSLERPGTILLLKYEDMKGDTSSNVKRLAEFIGYPFSVKEEKAGMVESIIKLCSFQNLSHLEVNKSGKHRPEEPDAIENRLYFRKAKDGDWEDYLTDEMKEKIDKLIDEKLKDTGLVLK